ncbi:hypothetical protein AB6A40_004377 [Gnathostoma spinigerum]|uniref:Major facilitator superfamily (MFS) profile domain-containing protein n=1 Tax=Gnathostoma spinigerum TaxID=75299 RepID=A0ABD6EL29_9BILA
MTLSTTLPSPRRRLFPSFRLLIVLLTMMAFFCTSTMKGNLGVAMVCMVNSTAVSKQPHPSDANISVDPSLTKCYSGNADEGVSRQAADYRGELLWTQQMQSHLFAASYYGSLVVAVPSGYIADIYGPKYVLLVSVADCAVMSFLGPFLANTNYYLFFASRVVLGLGEGLVLPGISSMAANWSPANERSTLAAIYTSGNQLSGAIGSVVSSSFCKLHFLGGWPLIFYFFGLVGVVFIVVWYFVTTNSPSSNRWIGNDEKAYLESELRHMSETRQTAVVPWLKLITSPRIIAILLCYSTFGFVNVIMQSYLPTFFKTVLHLKVLHNGFFTAIPWLSQLIGKNVLSLISDYFKRNGYFKPTTLVKIFQSIHGFGLALTMIALALFVDCTRTTLATFLLTSMGELHTSSE